MKKKLLKIAKITLWVCLVGSFFVLWGFAANKQKKVSLKELIINIDSGKYFITYDMVQTLLKDKKLVKNKKLENINTLQIEKSLLTNPYIKKVKAYKTIDGQLTIDIQQRKPILRVYNLWKESYYLDEEGYKIPESDMHTELVPIANGYIFNKVNDNEQLIKLLNSPSDSLRDTVLLELFNMAKYIQTHPFWQSQISQLYVNSAKEIEFTTFLGNQTVLFGHTDLMDKKFNNLFTLYNEGFSRVGWNNYSLIDLRFENQVVCKKK